MIWDKLHKLRDKSAHEWLTRGRQELAKWQERLFSKGCAEMSDAQLRKALSGASTPDILDETLSALRKRMRETPRLTPAFNQRAEVTRLMRERFPAETQRLIAQADDICAGRFTIFEQTFDFGTTPDWHREPRSGKRTPLEHWSKLDYLNPDFAGDKKFTWELSRHQCFITLGQAYWLTGDEKYAARFVELVNDWIAANPPKQGINWASSLELAFRVIAWTWALHYFADAPSVTNEFFKRMLKSLIQQTQHVETYLSHYFSPNTHLTGEALALLYVGTALPELQQAERWRSTGQRILLQWLPRHVGRDGVYFEQASYYHRYTADFYAHLWLLAEMTGEETATQTHEKLREKLTGLFEHLMWITRPDGTATFYGDDDGGKLLWFSGRKTDDWRDTLATGAALFNRSDWKSVAGEVNSAGELLWLLGAEGWQSYDALKAEAPTANFKAFVESGYYVMRDGWDGDAGYVLLDSGRHGGMTCGHAHSDALSFEFATAGVTWLVDPGTFTYTGDAALRNEIRSSFSHNTVSVDGETQSLPDKAFTWRHTAQSLVRECRNNDAELAVTGQQNGYVRLNDPVRQRRSFNFLKKNFAAANSASARLVIRDEMEALAAHRYALHFHFAPGCEVVIESEGRARVSHPTGKTLQVSWQKGSGEFLTEAEWQVTQGWVSRCYGQREPAQVLTISFEAKGEVAWETSLATQKTNTTDKA